MALFAFSRHAMDKSRYARFYSALTLLMLLTAIAGYAGLEKRRHSWGWLTAAAACALVAATLHPIAVAMGLVVQLYAAGAASVAAARGRRADAMWFAAIVALLVAAEAVAFAVPAVRQLLLRAALEPLPWYQPRAGDEWVYATHLAGQYGWLWYAAPAATVLAVWGGRSGWFVAAAFWVPFVFLTFIGATKHYRYAIPILPFAWLLWGGAAEQLVRSWDIGALARRRLAALRLRPAVALFIIALALGGSYALAKYTPSVRASLRRPTLSDSMLTTGFFYDWRTLQRELAPRLPADAVSSRRRSI